MSNKCLWADVGVEWVPAPSLWLCWSIKLISRPRLIFNLTLWWFVILTTRTTANEIALNVNLFEMSPYIVTLLLLQADYRLSRQLAVFQRHPRIFPLQSADARIKSQYPISSKHQNQTGTSILFQWKKWDFIPKSQLYHESWTDSPQPTRTKSRLQLLDSNFARWSNLNRSTNCKHFSAVGQ